MNEPRNIQSAEDRRRAQALNNRGELLASEGKYSEAYQSFQAAVRIDPNCTSAQTNLGALLIRSGKIQEGLQHYLRQIEDGNANEEILREVDRIISAIERGESVIAPSLEFTRKETADKKPEAPVPNILRCRTCGSSELLPAYGDHNWKIKFISHPVTYRKCSKCGTLSLLPEIRKAELNMYYENVYGYGDYRLMKNVKHYQSLERLEKIGKYLRSENDEPKLLDLGANYGHFLNTARGNGWDVEGIEISSESIEGARQLYGLDLKQKHLEDVTLPEEAYDAVTLWHVLEHSAKPGQVIRAASASLKPGGILAIAIPNIESLASRLCGWRWRWLSPPVHMNHLPESALVKICRENGMKPVRSLTRDNFGSRDFLFEYLTSGVLGNKKRRGSKLWKLVKKLEGDENTKSDWRFRWIWRRKTGTHLEWAARRLLEVEPRLRLRSYTRLVTTILHPLIRLGWSMGLGAELEIYFRKTE